MLASQLPRPAVPFTSPSPGFSDDTLPDEYFRRIAAQVESEAGIRLPSAKKSMVEGRLRVRARARGLDSLASYGRFLFSENGMKDELDAIIDCITTNKTDFFRESDHFDSLRDHLVPDLLSRDRSRRPIKLWSAAASSGAEAYTMAMVMDDLQATLPCAYEILATDISGDILEKAKRAIYSADMLSLIPDRFRTRYIMMARETKRHEFRIIPELRRRVQLQRLNLMDKSYDVARDQDIVFCRNVLIYFDRDVQRDVVARLTRLIRPGGYLLLGHSEAMIGSDHPGLRQMAPTIFQVMDRAP